MGRRDGKRSRQKNPHAQKYSGVSPQINTPSGTPAGNPSSGSGKTKPPGTQGDRGNPGKNGTVKVFKDPGENQSLEEGSPTKPLVTGALQNDLSRPGGPESPQTPSPGSSKDPIKTLTPRVSPSHPKTVTPISSKNKKKSRTPGSPKSPSRSGVLGVPRTPTVPLSQLGVEEQDRYIEGVIQSLRAPGGDDQRGQHIERVINSISDLLRLEESLEAETQGEEGGPQRDPKLQVGAEEEPQPCTWCESPAITRCTGCRLVSYCNRDCQRRDWKSHKERCRPYAVAKSKDAGRILVASRDLCAEDPVLLEAPLVLVLRPGATPLCLACYKKIHTHYRCSRCGLPLCSAECEEKDAHKGFECPVVASSHQKLKLDLEPVENLLEVVPPIRCLMAKRKDPQKWRILLEKFDSRFLELVGGSDSSSEQEGLMRRILDAASSTGLDAATGSEIHQILGLLRLHSIPIKHPYGEIQGLFPAASLLSHSCTPNTKIHWDGSSTKLRVTCCEPVRRGDPITTIYTDLLWGTRARRDHLQQTRMISCTCRRCKDPSEMGTNFSALICPRCPRRSGVLPQNPLDNSSVWKCGKCDYQISASDALEQTLTLGAAVSEALQSPTISSLELLQKQWGDRFHSNHYHLLALKHSLLQLYGRDQEKSEENNERHWEEMAKKERACKEFLHVVSLLDPALGNTVSFVGLAFFEYHKTILQSAKRNFGLAKLSALQLKKRMLLSKELLKKAMDMFREEAPDTPEGRLFLTCKEETIAIGKWMLAVGLV